MTNSQPESLPSSHEVAADTSIAGATSSDQGDKAKDRGGKDMRYAALTAAVYLIFLEIVARIPGGHIGLILATTLASLLYTLVFTVYMARGLRAPLTLCIVGLASFLFIAPSVVVPVALRMHPEWPLWAGLGPYFKHYRVALGYLPGVDGLLMVTCAVSIGVLISRIVKEFKMLLPIAVVLAIIDMYVVFGGGLVTQAVNGNDIAGKLMSSLTVKLPTVHLATGALPMQLELGFADFLFIGLFFACFVKFGVPSHRTFVVLCCTLSGVMLFVALLDVALPALVPIAVVVIGMNLRRFNFARDELFAMLYAGIIVAVIILVLVIRSHAMHREAAPPDLRKHAASVSPVRPREFYAPLREYDSLLRVSLPQNRKLGIAGLKHS